MPASSLEFGICKVQPINAELAVEATIFRTIESLSRVLSSVSSCGFPLQVTYPCDENAIEAARFPAEVSWFQIAANASHACR